MNSILRRRRALMGVKTAAPILPAEYQEVEWIESVGSQTYIDTGITLTNASLRLKFEGIFEGTTANGTYLFGDINTSTSNTCTALYFNSSKKIRWFTGANFLFSDSPVFDAGAKFVADCYFSAGNTNGANWSVSLDYSGNTISQTGTVNTIDYSHKLWVCGGTGQKPLGFHGKTIRAQAWNNDVLVFDGIPCYRKSDGVIGLYDLVSITFLTNTGTGTFTKGADV